MSWKYSVFAAAGLASGMTLLGTCLAVAAAPPDLPPLPPPDKPPAVVPLLPPPVKAPEAVVPVTLVPVEFTITIADLEKQMLRSFVKKLDPNAEPVLPIVVKGNERNFAPGAASGPVEVGKAVLDGVRGMRESGPLMHATRPQLIPRPPGVRPRLDRMAERPLVAAAVGLITGTLDLSYRIELRSLNLSVSGNVLTCEVGGVFHCDGMPPPQQGPVPGAPPPNVRDLPIKLRVTKKLEWSEAGKLELKDGWSQVWIDPEAPVVGFPRLDVERIVRLNGVLTLMGGALDHEVMKRLSAENLPDLAVIAPTLKQKMPFLTVSELTAYPIRGDDKNVYVSIVVGFIAASKKTGGEVKITSKPGPAPEPKLRGRILFDKDGKPEVKFDPAP